jgi:pilus assembly protein CpaB
LIALLIAILVAGSATAVVYRQLRAASGQRKVSQIVAAAEDLPAGVTVSAKDVVLVDWPSEVPLAGSFSKTEAVVGRPLIYSLKSREPILERDLAVAGAGIGLSAKIPPGMRATAVHANEITGVAGFLYPGSHVDVLATYNPPGGSGLVTRTVLQDVEVLAAGQTIEPDPQGKPQAVSVVTLLLSPEGSQKLLLSSTQGAIQFVLRSGIDKTKVDIGPTRLDQLLGSEKPPTEAPAVAKKPSGPQPAAPVKPPPAATPPREPFVLEVIQGTQRSQQVFPD